MRKFTRFVAASVLAISVPAAGAPVSGLPNTEDAVQEALAKHNLYEITIALNNLVEARLPPKETGRPDPVLDRMFADMFSAAGDAFSAGALLKRIVGDPATPRLNHYRLLLATYEESMGAWAKAQQYYRQIVADPKASPEVALSATLGVGRLQMASDPGGALATLQAARAKMVPPAMAWEVDLLIARAANMAGPQQASTAQAALDRAWAEAPYGEISASAVARVAGDRALVAGRAGDRKTLIAMLAVDRSRRSPNSGQQLMASNLPVCGTNGITPEDAVTVEVAHRAPEGRPSVTLVWASRAGIAAPFLLAAEKSGSPTVPDGQIAMFRLRCRTASTIEFSVFNSVGEELLRWDTNRGAYPKVTVTESNDDNVSMAMKFAQRQARYGEDSVMLLPILLRMTEPDVVNYADESGRKQASANVDHVLAILERNNAPASLILTWRVRSIAVAAAAEIKTTVEAQAEMRTLWGTIRDDPKQSLDTPLYMISSGIAQMPGIANDLKLTMLDSVLHLLSSKATADDRRLAAIALRLYQLRIAVGDKEGAQAAITGVRLPKDACSLSDPPARYVSSHMTSDDYPSDLWIFGMPGTSYAEFDLDAAGQARNGRLLVEDPPFAFSDITLARIPTIHYDPAHFDGKVAACRGATQLIRWALPDMP